MEDNDGDGNRSLHLKRRLIVPGPSLPERRAAQAAVLAHPGARVCMLAMAGCAAFVIGSVMFFPTVDTSEAVDTAAVHFFVLGSAAFLASSGLHWRHLQRYSDSSGL